MKKKMTAEEYIKTFRKKKKMPVYKAFRFTEPGDEMEVHVGVDLFSVTEDAAVSTLVNEEKIMRAEGFKGSIISFLVINFDVEHLLSTPLVDNGDVFFDGETMSISLKDKKYEIDVEDRILEDITIDVNQETDKRICTNIQLSEPIKDM